MNPIDSYLSALNCNNTYIKLFINDKYIGIINAFLLSIYLSKNFPYQCIYNNNKLTIMAPNIDSFLNELQTYLVSYNFVKKLRYEDMEVKCLDTGKLLFYVDREVLPFLGAKAHGIHINLYTEIDNKIFMWLAKRAKHKIDPGKLDNAIAGAVSKGYNVCETAIKEAYEEAGLVIIKTALKYQISLHYIMEKDLGIRNDCMHIFNMCVPSSFLPNNQDKEVEIFKLYSLTEIYDLLHNPNIFKTNSAGSILYFLWQKDIIKGKEKAKYTEIWKRLSLSN